MFKLDFINKLQRTNEGILVVFDNGGGVAMKLGAYKHNYDNPVQAAEDLIQAAKDDFDSTGWDGNDEDLVVDEDPEMERNGGIKTFSRYEISRAINDPDFDSGWGNVNAFIETLKEQLKTADKEGLI